jgi:pyruvate/2-oxoglutarate dehydrogenase complex dihydrolipoamide dehydrogenase (E3) component
MSGQIVDAIVIGLGPGGEDLAGRLARAGWSVLAVDEHLVGGECPYYGCIPTKMLLHESRRADPDWDRVAKRIRGEATDDWDDRAAVERLEGTGATVVRGHAAVDGGPDAAPGPGGTTVTVTPPDGGAPRGWTARRAVVLNTGSEPAVIEVPGLPASAAWTHRDVVRARSLPGRLAVIGGGPLGCELAQALAGFGVRVSMLVRGERLLSGEDPVAGELLADAFRANGIDVRTSTQVSLARETGGGRPGPMVLTLSTGEELDADRVLLATGRRPRDRVDVDEYCRVLSPRAEPVVGRYAIGDLTGAGPFTHTSMAQSALVARRLLAEDDEGNGRAGRAGRDGHGQGPPFPVRSVPRVTYTHPEVAAVGLSAGTTGTGDGTLRTARVDLAGSTRGWIDEVAGSLTLVAGGPGTPDAGLLVGASVVGPHAGEVIGALTVAVHARMALAELDRIPWAYPTLHRAIGTAVSELVE